MYFLKSINVWYAFILHPHLFSPKIMCEGEKYGFKDMYCYARLDVVSSVMIGIWQRLHRKLLLLNNSDARVHTHTSLGIGNERITMWTWTEYVLYMYMNI